jgi:hypothetical protein
LFNERKGLQTPCATCLPYLERENERAVNVFMLAINRLRYSSMGKPMGVDLNTVIELIKLMKDENPIDTIEKVMLLSKELIKNGE